MKAKAYYQHRVPLREGHPVKFDRNLPPRKRRCLVCGAQIIWVQGDSGPESLKALLRF